MSDTYNDDLPIERVPAKKTTTVKYVTQAKYDAEVSANNLLEIELENRLIEIERLTKQRDALLAEVERLKRSDSFLNEALNSGDGVYRP